VLTTSSVPEGEIAKARLEAEGIPVLAKGEGEGPYRVGPVHLFVPVGFEVAARLVLEAALAEGMSEDAENVDPEGDRPAPAG
jgi:hypothetical protein